jgi:hypothetical protein
VWQVTSAKEVTKRTKEQQRSTSMAMSMSMSESDLTLQPAKRSRPQTAPMHPRSATPATPFVVVTPVMHNREVLRAQTAHRTYSAGGPSGCPRNAEFVPAKVAWGLGPGSYSDEKPQKHSPTFEYAKTEASFMSESASAAQLKKVQSRSSMSSDMGHLMPKQLKPHQLKGPLLAQRHAYNGANHNKEEILKAALATALATPTVSVVHMLVPDSSFSVLKAHKHGASIPVGDIGVRGRIGPPSGPTLSASFRPQWEKLQIYVPPAVTGPCATFGQVGNLVTELDDEGRPMHSQARLKELAEQGHQVRNFVEKNRFAQRQHTAATKHARVKEVNAEIAQRRLKVQAFLVQQQAEKERALEESTRDKDVEYRAERRRKRQELAELVWKQTTWLKYIVLAQSSAALRSVRENILRHRLKVFAARKIWRFYRAWKQRSILRILEMRQAQSRQRPRSGAVPIAKARGASPAGTTRQLTFNLPGVVHLATIPASPRQHSVPLAGGATSPGISPRTMTPRTLAAAGGGSTTSPRTPGGSVIHPGNISPSQLIRDRGLHSLLALQTHQHAVHVLCEFLDWALLDRFTKVKRAMLSFRRKARLIQQWWRNHLLAQQWRLWIQILQFLSYRDRALKRDHEEMRARSQEKMDSFHQSLASSAGSAIGTAVVVGLKGKNGQTQLAVKKGGSRVDTGKRSAARPSSAAVKQPSRSAAFDIEEKESSQYVTSTPPHLSGLHDLSHQHSSSAVEDPLFRSQVTFASSSSFPLPDHASLLPSSNTVRGAGAFRNDFSQEDRGNPTRVAQRVFSHWVTEEMLPGANAGRRRPLRKFPVPVRSAGWHPTLPLSPHSALAQWNLLVFFQREVFRERQAIVRGKFRDWVKGMRIEGVREELLAASGTVKPLTEEERERLRVGGDISFSPTIRSRLPQSQTMLVGANRWQAPGASMKVRELEESSSSSSSDSSSSDEDAGGDSAHSPSDPTKQRTADLRRKKHRRRDDRSKKTDAGGSGGKEDKMTPLKSEKRLTGGSRSSSKRSLSPSRPMSPSSTKRPLSPSKKSSSPSRKHSKSGPQSFLSRLQPPSFFKLLLTDAELAAMHRGANTLVQHMDPRWTREAAIHAPFLLTQRLDHETAAHGSGVGPPMPVGHKQTVRRFEKEKAAAQARENNRAEAEREASAASGVSSAAAAAATSSSPSVTSWPNAVRLPNQKDGKGQMHLVLNFTSAAPGSATPSAPASQRRARAAGTPKESPRPSASPSRGGSAFGSPSNANRHLALPSPGRSPASRRGSASIASPIG